MGAEKREFKRKPVDYVHINDLISLDNYTLIASQGYIVDASTSSFKLIVARQDLASHELRGNLHIDSILGQEVVLHLPQMNLDLDGRIEKTRYCGRGNFELVIHFLPHTPDYWKDCLIDLLPGPGEI